MESGSRLGKLLKQPRPATWYKSGKVNHHRIVAAHLAQHALRTAMGRLSKCPTSSHCHRKAYGHPIHQLVPRKV